MKPCINTHPRAPLSPHRGPVGEAIFAAVSPAARGPHDDMKMWRRGPVWGREGGAIFAADGADVRR